MTVHLTSEELFRRHEREWAAMRDAAAQASRTDASKPESAYKKANGSEAVNH